MIKKTSEESEIRVFLHSCQEFLIEVFNQVKTRFDLNNPVFDLVEWTLPSNAFKRNPPNLTHIETALPHLREHLDMESLEGEWRGHIFTKDLNADLPWEDYWTKVKHERFLDGRKYENLMKLLGIVASLPFSNVAVERLFSQLKLVKREQRTSLKPQNLAALLQTKFTLANKNCTAASLDVSPDLIKLADKAKANATDEEVKELKHSFCEKVVKGAKR